MDTYEQKFLYAVRDEHVSFAWVLVLNSSEASALRRYATRAKSVGVVFRQATDEEIVNSMKPSGSFHILKSAYAILWIDMTGGVSNPDHFTLHRNKQEADQYIKDNEPLNNLSCFFKHLGPQLVELESYDLYRKVQIEKLVVVELNTKEKQLHELYEKCKSS